MYVPLIVTQLNINLPYALSILNLWHNSKQKSSTLISPFFIQQDNLRSQLGCGYKSAVRGVNRERYVMVVKAGCVTDGKICMSQRKVVKTVIAWEKKRSISS